ncbi:MAG: glycosyltransferase [Ginsengibacter sp.]
MKNKKSIVFLGYGEFPYGFAEVQKIILISKSLIISNNKVTVICRNGYHNSSERPNLNRSGVYENINYIYASGSVFRNKNFLRRRINHVKGRINEILLLRNYKKRKELDYAILSTRNFYSIVYYSILSKLFKFKTILNYVEYYSAMEKGKFQISKKINDTLFDRLAPSISDAVFPISEFLIEQTKRVSPYKNYLKIPGLTDFDNYKGIETLNIEKYFLFCGHAAYKEIIYFIIDSYSLLKSNSVKLYLVINGDQEDLNSIKEYALMKDPSKKINIYSKLSQKELFTYYYNALALLIPLRPTFQDIARFPHKTGEYLASGNPVISTNYGEVKNYFTDGENMLLAEAYDIYLFAEKMEYAISNPQEVKEIGLKGKNVAIKLFDYRYKAQEIDDFLNSVLTD